MDIQIQAIHFSVSQKLKSFINKKIDKLISIDNNVMNGSVYLKIEKPESYDNKIVEIKLKSSDAEYFSKKQSNSFEASTDLAIQALRRQIIKQKSK